MPKVADVKISWVRSPSADVTRRTVEVTINGQTTMTQVGPEVSEYVLEIAASGSVSVKTTVFDESGKQASSEVYSFRLDDLEAPLPDTDLIHEVLAVRDTPS